MLEPPKAPRGKGETLFLLGGGEIQGRTFFSLEHALEVHSESQEIQDDAWDCTLIKTMKEKKDSIVNPIYEWLDSDIWDYIRQQNIKVNPLYDRGYSRVGCVGCPLAGYKHKLKEFADYPQYKQLYINAFEKMIQERKQRGMKTVWTTGEECFDWWLENSKHEVKGQMSLWEE